jgi:hypothetical protein
MGITGTTSLKTILELGAGRVGNFDEEGTGGQKVLGQ